MFELKTNYGRLTKQRFPQGTRQKTVSAADIAAKAAKPEGWHEAEAHTVELKRSRDQITWGQGARMRDFCLIHVKARTKGTSPRQGFPGNRVDPEAKAVFLLSCFPTKLML